MTDFPKNLRYSKSHEWARREEDNIITIGITDYAQSMLGDLVFVELPEKHKTISVGEEVAVIESVKTAADVYTPVAGEVIEINEVLTDKPETINQDPYGEGWLFKIKATDISEIENLMDADTYIEQVEE